MLRLQIACDDFDGLQCDLDGETDAEPPEKLRRTPRRNRFGSGSVIIRFPKVFVVLIASALSLGAGLSLGATNWTLQNTVSIARVPSSAHHSLTRPERAADEKAYQKSPRRSRRQCSASRPVGSASRAFERLKQLKIETEASTYAEVIKNALKLYASAVEFQKDGGKFLVQAKDGASAPLILFG